MARFTVRITDANGRSVDRVLKAATYSKAWKEYIAAAPFEPGAIRRVDLIQDGKLVHLTRYELAGTPDAYTMRQTPTATHLAAFEASP